MNNYPDGMRPGDESLPDLTCEECDKKITEEEAEASCNAYETDDMFLCSGCLEWAIDKAEMMAESESEGS